LVYAVCLDKTAKDYAPDLETDNLFFDRFQSAVLS